MLRILIRGSRKFTDYKKIFDSLNKVEAKYPSEEKVLIAGGGSGVDRVGEQAAKRLGWRVEKFVPELKNPDEKAGRARNIEMIDSGVDYCLAFPHPDTESKSTMHCVDYAKENGVKTYVL